MATKWCFQWVSCNTYLFDLLNWALGPSIYGWNSRRTSNYKPLSRTCTILRHHPATESHKYVTTRDVSWAKLWFISFKKSKTRKWWGRHRYHSAGSVEVNGWYHASLWWKGGSLIHQFNICDRILATQVLWQRAVLCTLVKVQSPYVNHEKPSPWHLLPTNWLKLMNATAIRRSWRSFCNLLASTTLQIQREMLILFLAQQCSPVHSKQWILCVHHHPPSLEINLWHLPPSHFSP